MISELSREMTSEECFCNLKIVNLSSKELTEGQIKLLSKGLKFHSDSEKRRVKLVPIYKTSARSYGKKNFSRINRTLQTPTKVWRKIKVTSALLETETLP